METELLVANAFERSPRILLLGQTFLGGLPSNPLFAAFSEAFSTVSPYSWWLENEIEPEDRALEFRTVDRAIRISERLSSLLRANWSCVFTSCIDSATRQQLEIPNQRLLTQITSPGFDRTDKGVLTLLRLFGTVERPVLEDLPPVSPASLRRRRTDAGAMLSKLPEIVTPTGRLFIEGWNPLPEGDWLRPRDLDKSLMSFLPEQVLIFGLTDLQKQYLEDEDDFGELIRQRIVLLFTERLADIFPSLIGLDLLRPEVTQSTPGTQVFYQVLVRRPDPKLIMRPTDESIATIPIDPLQWRRLTQSITIIEDLDPTQPMPGSKTSKQDEFRRFLGNNFTSPPWKWLQHFAFQRHALTPLRELVLKLAALDTPQDHLVILSGPSGSGKTVLLQILALSLRRNGLPVVYIDGGPNFGDYGGLVDEFCLLLDSFSAAPVIVIFDALERDDAYLTLVRYLAGLGRKCLVIGSTFSWQRATPEPHRHEKKLRPSIHHFPLAPMMESDEKNELLIHLQTFLTPDLPTLEFLHAPDVSDCYFFAVLYRLLPDARRPLERGIIDELKQGAEKIQGSIEETRGQDYVGMTLMEKRIRAALQHHQDLLLGRIHATDTDGDRYEVKDALLLINAVLLASMVGQSVPISLALRLIRNDFRAYAKSIPEEIIVEHETSDGSLNLSARHQLEAEIWIKHRLPRDADKADLLERLAVQIRENEVGEDQCPELEFVVKILQAFGPQGPQRFRLVHCYDRIADIVKTLRSRYRRVHPRLLLLASNAIREWIQVLQGEVDVDASVLPVWSARLDEAESELSEAIDIVRANAERPLRGAPRRLLATLETELACLLGVQVGSIRRIVGGESLLLPAWQSQLDTYFTKARGAWLRALQYSEDNPYSFDTICWISDERLQAGGLDDYSKTELLAGWAEAIDRYSSVELPPSRSEKRDRRELEFSRALGSRERFESVLHRLSQRNPSAAFALEARFIAFDEGAVAACAYLDSNCGDSVLVDRTLIILYFRLWWQAETGHSTFFPEDYLTLTFGREKWMRLQTLCEARLRCEGERENGTALFLEATALLHLGLTTQALRVFEKLESLDIGGFRRARVLVVLAGFDGRRREFSGEFRGRRRGSNYFAWCDDLGMDIPFKPAEHHFLEPREGKVIGPFLVALSYRGPYALPLYRAQRTGAT